MFIPFLVFYQQGIAQTIIKGHAPGRSGKYAVLYAYPDLITYVPQRLDSGIVESDGSFSISSNNDYTFYGFILIGEANFLLYVEPGNEYVIEFPEALTNITDSTFQHKSPELFSEAPGKLNDLTATFNAEYNTFLQENYTLFLNRKATVVADTFVHRIKRKYKNSGGDYFRDFVSYSCAGIQQAAFSNAKWLFDFYLHSKPIAYYNTAYMNFLLNFYGKSLLNEISASDDRAIKLKEAINADHSISKACGLLDIGQAKEDKQLRELVLLIGLYRNYGNPALKTNSIEMMLDHAFRNSEYPQNNLIAKNMLDKLTRLRPESPAPKFSLYDIDSNIVNIDDFKGKFVYLDFWATWCKPCMSEMKLMPKLHEDYGDDFVIISISLDRNRDKWREFIHQHPEYKWLFLHYGNNPQLQEKYNIKGIPTYYLIDPDGKLLLSPAPRPSENIGDIMKNISMKIKPRR